MLQTEKILTLGIVPVIKIEKAEWAVPLGKALIEGGLPVAEITFRTSCAAEAISEMHQHCPEILLGAGTITTREQVDAAMAAGAGFLVSPGFNPVIADYCMKKGIPHVPGVTSPSLVEQAMEKGLRLLKFFPAEAAGGIPMLKALSAVYPEVQFMPTGGINPENLLSYLNLPNVAACGGTWMIDSGMMAAGDFEGITRLCREAVSLAAQRRHK